MFIKSLKAIKQTLSNDREENRYYQNQYSRKLEEIDNSFTALKKSSNDLASVASEISTMLKRHVEMCEKRFVAITNFIDDVVIIKTINRQWTHVNKYTCKVFGIDPEVCIGKSNDEIIAIYPHLKPILTKLSEVEKESWNQRRIQCINLKIDVNGIPTIFDVNINPIETNDGVMHEIIVVGKNITPCGSIK